jgi:hypothetical protein
VSASPLSPQNGGTYRPRSVNVAVWLLVVVGVLAVINAITTIVSFRHAAHASGVAFAQTWDGFVNPNAFRQLMALEIGLGIITACGIIVLALLLRRGSSTGRIGVIILSGMGLVCFGAATWLNPGRYGYGGVPGDEVTLAAQQSAAGLPAWSRMLMTTGAITSFVLLIAVIILVTRPAARAFAPRRSLPPTDAPTSLTGS